MNVMKMLLVFLVIVTTAVVAKPKNSSATPLTQNISSQDQPIVSKRKMENTGQKPDNFRYFIHPKESLKIAFNYLPANPVIVEAGAFDGDESCVMAAYWPKGHVHCFEPIQSLFEIVKLRTRGVANISAYKLALGNHSGEQVMYLSNNKGDSNHVSMSSSLYAPKEHLVYAPTEFNGQEIVAVTTLDAWAQEHEIPKVDMLWLDMQGGELDALKAAPTLLSGVSVILTELEFVEAYEGQPLY